MQLTNVVNYPNPFVSSTVFTFEHNLVSSVDVDIRIYTVAGRLIQTLHRSGLATRLVRIPWDGRDRDADPIANGVYLYKVTAKTTDGRLSAEALGKLSILK
jgi:flagellar hook assembly protein FlgD